MAHGNRVNAFRDDPSALLCLLTRIDETDRWKGAEASITRLAREREAKDPLLGSPGATRRYRLPPSAKKPGFLAPATLTADNLCSVRDNAASVLAQVLAHVWRIGASRLWRTRPDVNRKEVPVLRGFRRHQRTWADVNLAEVGGEGGIRTRDTLASMPHFECGAFNHSATSPKPSHLPLSL